MLKHTNTTYSVYRNYFRIGKDNYFYIKERVHKTDPDLHTEKRKKEK